LSRTIAIRTGYRQNTDSTGPIRLFGSSAPFPRSDMKHREAAIAVRRFGLGPRPGDPARIAADPRGYVLAALQRKDGARITDDALEAGDKTLSSLRAVQKAQKEQRAARAAPLPAMTADDPTEADKAGASLSAAKQGSAGNVAMAKPGVVARDTFREEAGARLARATTTDQPFLERLVMFWSSHFAVSVAKGPALRALAGAFEREAIRPLVLGRFADMLKAAEQHPAMLIYLDNAQSIGPNSRAGQNRGRGLNENLAREILELHTLGVGGGYSQADVTSFARILTGWTVANEAMAATLAMQRQGGVVPGGFVFTPNRHEPGAQTVLGKRYEDRGRETGEAVLADLARHPATARHLATRFAAHFVSQSPPPALVARLAQAFTRTDGDLSALARTLAEAPEAWEAPPRKVVPPYDFMVSLSRAFALEEKQRLPMVLRLSAAIGQPLWAPPSPKGWPDDDDAWMGPSAVRERLRIAERVARQIDRGLDPRAAAADLLGDAMSEHTRLAIARAEAREQGLELLIMSPEFLRR
jgi:uncharacterized protein (DUF1800 family)